MRFRKIAKGRFCPACQSPNVYRLKREGLTVRAVCGIFGLRPYWCAECDTFFLAPKTQRSPEVKDAGSVAPTGSSSGANPPLAGSAPH